MKTILNDFKTIQCAVFVTDIDRTDRSVYRFLLPKLMASHTDEIVTKQAMSETLEDLYGAYVSTRVERIGNLSVMSYMLTLPHPDIVDDPSLFENALKLFKDMLIRKEAFQSSIFDEEKRQLIEQWQTLKDKKRLYASTRFQSLFFDKDPYGYPLSGTLKDIKKLTPELLFSYYQETMATNRMDVVINGRLTGKMIQILETYLPVEREKVLPFETTFRNPHPLQTTHEPIEMQQAIIKIGYVLPIYRKDPLFDAAVLTDIMLGGYPESRLFKVIREDKGLCYDVQSAYDYYKGVLLITSGVDAGRKDEAVDAIQDVIQSLIFEGVTEEALANAKSFYAHQLKTSLDNQSTLTKRAFIRHMLDYQESIEDRLISIDRVNKEMIQDVLNQLTIDTVYVLFGGRS